MYILFKQGRAVWNKVWFFHDGRNRILDKQKKARIERRQRKDKILIEEWD